MEILRFAWKPSKNTNNLVNRNQITTRHEMDENEEILCITLDSDEEDEGTATSFECFEITIPVIKMEPIDEQARDFEILTKECPRTSSSSSSEIGDHKKAQASIQAFQNPQPVADNNIPSLSEEGPRITSKPILFPIKVEKSRVNKKVGNNDSMILSNVSNEESIQMSIPDNPTFPSIVVEEDETVELEKGTNSNRVTTSVSSSFENTEKERAQDGNTEVQKGIKKSQRKRKATKPFSASSYATERGRPRCKNKFPSNGKRDDHIAQNRTQTRSIPECGPVKDTNGPSKKGMRKSTRKRKGRKPWNTSGRSCNYRCPHCKKRFASSDIRDYHVKIDHNKDSSNPDCRQVEDNDGPSSKKVLFRTWISNLNSLTTQFPDERDGDDPTYIPPANLGTRTKSQTWRKSVRVRKDLPSRVSDALSSTEKNKCDICEKTYCNMYLLKRHQELHSGVYPFECSLCDKKFPGKYYYQNHLKTKGHREARKEIIVTRDETEPQGGSFISAEVSSEDIMMSSVAAVNNNVTQTFNGIVKKLGKNINYLLECGECGAGFVCNADLVSHVGNFHPDKRYKCDMCSIFWLSRGEADMCYQSHFKTSLNEFGY